MNLTKHTGATMNQSTFTIGMHNAQGAYKEVVVTLPGNAHLYDNNNDADAPAFDAFCVAAESLAQSQNKGFEATSCRLQALGSTNQAYPEAAQALGAKAFADGIVAPCFDKALLGLFAGREVGDPRTYTEMRAWIKGRTLAMLAAPVAFEDATA